MRCWTCGLGSLLHSLRAPQAVVKSSAVRTEDTQHIYLQKQCVSPSTALRHVLSLSYFPVVLNFHFLILPKPKHKIRISTQKQYATMAREPGIHWEAPSYMLGALVGGVLLAIAYHCFYSQLNGCEVSAALINS